MTTVDAVQAQGNSTSHAEAVKQVAIADRLLLTKTDLADADGAIADVRARLARLNPGATLSRVQHGEIEPDQLFGAALFDPAAQEPGRPALAQREAYAHDHHGHDHDHAAHASALHDRDIRSFCIVFEEPARLDDGERTGSASCGCHGANGCCGSRAFSIWPGRAAPVAIHGVHHVFHPPVVLNAWTDDDRRSRIVFITRGLAREDVEQSWRVMCGDEMNA